jgi:hypothetical protein
MTLTLTLTLTLTWTLTATATWTGTTNLDDFGGSVTSSAEWLRRNYEHGLRLLEGLVAMLTKMR